MDSKSVNQLLDAWSKGEYGAEHEFALAAKGASERLEGIATRQLEGGWTVRYGMAFSPGEQIPALRIAAVLVTATDPSELPAGGLTHTLLRKAITGTDDVLNDAYLERWKTTYKRTGKKLTPKRELELKREVRRLSRTRPPTSRGYGPAFYARVAWDAIELADQGHRAHVLIALLAKYERQDPRPASRRTRRITYTTVKGWIWTARKSRFLPSAGRGVSIYERTPELLAFGGGKKA